MNIKIFIFCIFSAMIFAVSSCSKETEEEVLENSFNKDALESAENNSLFGFWAITKAEFEGIQVEIPVNYQDCGREFFVFSETGDYTEYLYQSSACDLINIKSTWNLNKGIVSFKTLSGSQDEWVLTNVTSNRLTFKVKLDVTEDGEKDIVFIFADRFTPKENDFVTQSFTWERNTLDEEGLIRFSWIPYTGFNEFNRYEVYRSAGENCSKSNAELIATITDVSNSEVTDLTPAPENRLCYFLRLYTDKGLLGESIVYDITTDGIIPKAVTLEKPEVLATSINLSWAVSNDPYFSHYEITYSNYPPGTGATAYQEYSLKTIANKEETTFSDNETPYLENPFYTLYVYNIFGNRSSNFSMDITNFWEVAYKRPELLGVKKIDFFEIASNEPLLYFYGGLTGSGNEQNLYAYNYNSKSIVAEANIAPGVQTEVPFKLIQSEFGNELIMVQGLELHVYNATDLSFKYAIDPEGIVTIDDFGLDLNGNWILIDDDNLFTYNRNESLMELIASQNHFTEHQGGGNYTLLIIDNNQVLVGHHNEATSFLIAINSEGGIQQSSEINIPIKQGFSDSKTFYNALDSFVLNVPDNRIYSTQNFALTETIVQPYNISGISRDGNVIYGTNNYPSWQITDSSLHKKEAISFNRNTNELKTYTTTGYSLLMFEDDTGRLFSLSSGLKKNRLGDNHNDKGDLFIEEIN